MKKNPFSNLTKLSTGLLQDQAAAYLTSGSYKITQEIYKILLKRENKPSYRQGLAECYLQRSLISAEQGKVKAAITLWENYTEYENSHNANAQYVSWLLKAGQKAKIKTYLQRLEIATLEKDYPQLALILGYYHLSGQIDLLQWLPEETSLAKQTHHAQLALTALQQNDPQLMRLHLTKIPYRSAYRDLCALLKAVSLLTESIQQGIDLINKIEPDSPYSSISKLFAVLPLSGREFMEELLTLSHKQQQIICASKNWTPLQIKLLQAISRQKRQLTDKIKFDLAIQYQQLLGTDYAQRFCLALLAVYPAGKRVYEKNFGALDAFEKLRFSALNAESKRNNFDAIDYWDQSLELLYEDKQHNALKIAFILRHMAELCSPSEGIDYLTESLEFDIDDRETHLQILEYHANQEDKKYFKSRLQEALTQFPEDIEFLAFAMQAAINNKAFKKATQFADKILAIDPVNTQAKHILFSSHLNHARKLLKTKKFRLIEKEITTAEKLNLGKHFSLLTQILVGFFVYVSEEKAKGIQLIEASRKISSEGDFICRYRIISEALLLEIPLTPLLRSISLLANDYVFSATELNAFLKLLDEQQKEDPAILIKALNHVKKDFKRIIKQQQFDQVQLLAIMQRLDRIKHFELMQHCFKCVTDKQSNSEWGFYKIYIKAKGNPANVPTMSISILQLQHHTAMDQGDQRTATLISNFLDKIHRYHSDAFSIADADEYFDPFEVLFDHIDARSFARINRKFDQLHESLTEDNLVKTLIEMLPDKKSITILLKDFEVMNALLFLKAAQELDIDINVSVKDILKLSQQHTGASLPFPL